MFIKPSKRHSFFSFFYLVMLKMIYMQLSLFDLSGLDPPANIYIKRIKCTKCAKYHSVCLRRLGGHGQFQAVFNSYRYRRRTFYTDMARKMFRSLKLIITVYPSEFMNLVPCFGHKQGSLCRSVVKQNITSSWLCNCCRKIL